MAAILNPGMRPRWDGESFSPTQGLRIGATGWMGLRSRQNISASSSESSHAEPISHLDRGGREAQTLHTLLFPTVQLIHMSTGPGQGSCTGDQPSCWIDEVDMPALLLPAAVSHTISLLPVADPPSCSAVLHDSHPRLPPIPLILQK